MLPAALAMTVDEYSTDAAIRYLAEHGLFVASFSWIRNNMDTPKSGKGRHLRASS